ncbi:MAG: hypothetical protein ACD_60C00130G0003 [uncultured bacterium]|nr:MAG: hypothetical protein ACD_60C00130G0003 [uncultured bacterium]
MNNLLHLFAMGNYGWYVWPAYGITLAVFGINVWIFSLEKKQIKKIIQQYLNHQP